MLSNEYKQLYWRKSGEYKHFFWKRKIVIGKDGKVNIPSIDVPLAHGCNLKCECCFPLNPLRTGLVSREMIADSFEKWSRKIFPERVILTGGEPLLNPEIVQIVADVSRYWQQSQCELWTNGLLLPRTSDDVLREFKKHKVFVCISQHLDTDEYRETLKQSLQRLKRLDVRCRVFESYRDWRGLWNLDTDGVPIPCRSSHDKSYGCCYSKRCTLIHGDYLYRCNFLAHLSMALQEKAIGPEWAQASTHKPASFENTPKEGSSPESMGSFWFGQFS